MDEVDDDEEDVLPSVDWSPEKGFPDGTPITHLPWRPWGPGTDNGLSIVLDAEIDEYRCSSETSVGFKVKEFVTLKRKLIMQNDLVSFSVAKQRFISLIRRFLIVKKKKYFSS